MNGNHECNAPWKRETAGLLSNAVFLCDSGADLRVVPWRPPGSAAASSPPPEAVTVRVWGTNFFWPMTTPNPHYALVPAATDVLVSHGPAKGRVDKAASDAEGGGCETLMRHVKRVRPRLFVCGHLHHAHGVERDGAEGDAVRTAFVNAANCRDGYKIGWDPVAVDI